MLYSITQRCSKYKRGLKGNKDDTFENKKIIQFYIQLSIKYSQKDENTEVNGLLIRAVHRALLSS